MVIPAVNRRTIALPSSFFVRNIPLLGQGIRDHDADNAPRFTDARASTVAAGGFRRSGWVVAQGNGPFSIPRVARRLNGGLYVSPPYKIHGVFISN